METGSEPPNSTTGEAEPEADALAAAITTMRTGLAAQKAGITAMERTLRRLERDVRRLQRAARPPAARTGQGRRKRPTGFARPGAVTPALLEFLGRGPGELVARTEATRELNAYIKSNNLQDPADAKVIRPDVRLRQLLAVDEGTTLTYFNIQQHMNPHFVRPAAAAVGVSGT